VPPSVSPLTVTHWLRDARQRLEAVTDEGPLEAELLLRHVTGRSRATLMAWPDATLHAAHLDTLAALLARRLEGEPLAYLTGTREFWSMAFEVTPAVLIPRPDTETLVERALVHVADDPDGLVIDAGTGSGAVAIALATECLNPIVATDASAEALAVAARNARRLLPPGRVMFVRGDWLAAFGNGCAATIVSNPPYLATGDAHLLALRREPAGALVSGDDGLSAIETLARQARTVGRAATTLLLEHGAEQGAAVRQCLAEAGWERIATFADLASRERVSEGRRTETDTHPTRDRA